MLPPCRGTLLALDTLDKVTDFLARPPRVDCPRCVDPQNPLKALKRSNSSYIYFPQEFFSPENQACHA